MDVLQHDSRVYTLRMKETLTKLAKYNATANLRMLDAIAPLSHAELTRNAGSYFGSILGLVNHLLKSDIGWLNRLRGVANHIKSLDTPFLEIPRALAFTENLFDELPPLRDRRMDVDEVFVAFVGEATAEYLQTPGTFVNRQGKAQVLRPGDILLHLFNHSTHHRGAISQILDTMSVENDFSSLMSTLE